MHYTNMTILNITLPMVLRGGEIPYVFEELTSMPSIFHHLVLATETMI